MVTAVVAEAALAVVAAVVAEAALAVVAAVVVVMVNMTAARRSDQNMKQKDVLDLKEVHYKRKELRTIIASRSRRKGNNLGDIAASCLHQRWSVVPVKKACNSVISA